MMLKEERYNKIYEILQDRNSVTVQFLEKNLYASEATIRRDLEMMENKGLIKRVWGGAILPKVDKDIPPFVREKSNTEKKQKIAEIASGFLKNSMSYFINSSTTCLPLAEYFSNLKNISVITNSLKMSKQLSDQTSANLILTGGDVIDGYILSGLTARKAISNYYVDYMFFSCSGISIQSEITSIDNRVVEIDQAMMNHANKKILLCDTSKVGKSSLIRLASISEIDYIVMDSIPTDNDLVNLLGEKLIVNSAQVREIQK